VAAGVKVTPFRMIPTAYVSVMAKSTLVGLMQQLEILWMNWKSNKNMNKRFWNIQESGILQFLTLEQSTSEKIQIKSKKQNKQMSEK
jgi:hypothetical protein